MDVPYLHRRLCYRISWENMVVNRSKTKRQALLATLLTSSMVVASTGCTNTSGSRIAALNPFAKSTPTIGSKPSTTESFAAGTKNMFQRSSDAITGVFARNRDKPETQQAKSEVDPLKLDRETTIGPEVFVANGRLWETSGNDQKAMENYTKALEKQPNYPDALTNIARLHFKKGKHQQAADFFGRAIKQKPDDADLYNDLGLTLSKMGNHAVADQMLSKALQLSPGKSRYANNLASVKFESGDKPGAFNVLSSANKPAVAHFNMAYLYFNHGEMADAEKHLNEVIKFQPQSAVDTSIKQAVDRSRQLLAHIAGPGATVAQAVTGTPAQTASARMNQIRQTSQSTLGSPNQHGVVQTKTAQLTKPGVGIKPTQSPPTLPQKSAIEAKPGSNTTPSSEVPTMKVETPANQATGASFAMPPSFTMPPTK